jgi:hypothetical protein
VFRNYLGLRLRNLIWLIKGVGRICVMKLVIGLMVGLKVDLGVFGVVVSRSYISVTPLS